MSTPDTQISISKLCLTSYKRVKSLHSSNEQESIPLSAPLPLLKNLEYLKVSSPIYPVPFLDNIHLCLPRLKDLSFNFAYTFNTFPLPILQLTNLCSFRLYSFTFTEVPIELATLQNLESLTLFFGKLDSIGPGITDLPNLKRLDLYSNCIKRLPDDYSKLSKSLTHLNLGYNFIQQHDQISKLFQLPLLNHVIFSATPFLHIDPEPIDNEAPQPMIVPHDTYLAFSTLPSLSYLDLSRWRFETFPQEITTLKHLETLIITHSTSITTLPIEISNLVHLQSLNLSKCGFTSVPAVIYTLNLKRLLFDYNFIQDIPPQLFDSCLSLEYLSFKKCGLSMIPINISNLKNLNTLQVSSNSLFTLPNSLKHCSKLRKFIGSSNSFRTFPMVLTKLPSLDHIFLRKNEIPSIPPQIGNLTKLTYFTISHNKLTCVPPQVLSLPLLNTFNHSQNQIPTS